MGKTEVKTAGFIMNFQAHLDDVMNGLKAIEEDLDETLQQILVKSSGHIQLSKKLGEMELIMDFLKEQGTDEPSKAKNLIKALRKKVYECMELLISQVQKSMIKAVEALSDTQNGIIMINKLSKFIKKLEMMEGMIKE
ncbi:MAG: hypothetical protein L5655_05245 [Thermosediminibacteraceae bacterium]|nr:hypothetical protein [Thermosediminibacteraceae bacterium]